MHAQSRTSRRGEPDDHGFTLIELLVVVIIIGILAAISIPTFIGQREKAWEAAAKADLRSMLTAQYTHNTKFGNYADTIAELTDEDFTATDRVFHAVCVVSNNFYIASRHEGMEDTLFIDGAQGTIERSFNTEVDKAIEDYKAGCTADTDLP